jgi:hypothetical protein
MAAGAFVTAAMVTLVLHLPSRAAHISPRDHISSVSGLAAEEAAPGFSRARISSPSGPGTSRRSETANEDRVPGEGLPRRMLVNYTWETR